MKKIIIGLFVLGFLVLGGSQALATNDLNNTSSDQAGDVDSNPGSSECVVLVNNLRYKDRDFNKNGEVSTLQDFLQSKGYINNEPTGYFGILTFKGVKDFQRANNITPTGYVGPVTRALIKKISCDGIASLPVEPAEVCCEIFGYGAEMIKTQSIYKMMPKEKCTVGLDFAGGGRNIVAKSFCIAPTPLIHPLSLPLLPVNSSITVLSPNGGETLIKEKKYTIKWKDDIKDASMAPKYYDINLAKYSPFTCSHCPERPSLANFIIAEKATGSSYDWQIKNLASAGVNDVSISDGQYVIEICQSGTKDCDSSDSYFKIFSSDDSDDNNDDDDIVSVISCGNKVGEPCFPTKPFIKSSEQEITPVDFNRELRIGLSGDDVKKIQEFLKEKNLLSVTATGYFGNYTKEAVRKYQKQNKIGTKKGEIDIITLQKIVEEIQKSLN
jgi:peptidoglycan hydrolase-like protein with peptidoglycan-binding domain